MGFFLMIVLPVVLTAVGLWITYFLIKCAIRDGIKESGLAEAILALRTPVEVPSGPGMRAER